MQRNIVGYHQDTEAHWVAELECGHTQHVRHAPPWQERPWVISQEGRDAHLGQPLDCQFCEMGAVPQGYERYSGTRQFSEQDVPAALLAEHRTKPGVWGHIVVQVGRLEYHCPRGVFVLRPGVLGVVEPDTPHHLRILAPVRFHVDFLRAPGASDEA
ncbi:MAG: DUF3565 domain-containing protein [Myxococcales bacterium]|nr:DUF3565 domain-containing protein [Myxococcales bacterium]